jgi:HK97 gp10 family phage protein|tara:strand:+ start:21704 stop:22138 length:435 start_codon:yes stop_codon:yes gene_type:complete
LIKAKINSNSLLMLKKKLKALEDLSKQELSNELGRMALDSSRRAKKTAPVDTGNLKNSIGVERLTKTSLSVFAKAKYAPYVEFGTGKVNLEDMKQLGIPDSYAAQFKGAKSGHMRAQPYFFISIRKAFAEGLKRVEAIIKKEIK